MTPITAEALVAEGWTSHNDTEFTKGDWYYFAPRGYLDRPRLPELLWPTSMEDLVAFLTQSAAVSEG